MKDALIRYGLSVAIVGITVACTDNGRGLKVENPAVPSDFPVRTVPAVRTPVSQNARTYETPTVPAISSQRAQYNAESTVVALATQERHRLLYGSPVPSPVSAGVFVLRDGTRSSPTSFKIIELISQPGRTVNTRHDREVSGTICIPKSMGKATILDCQTQYRDVSIYETDGPDRIARVEQCQDLGIAIDCTNTPLFISDEVYRTLHVGQLVEQTSLGKYATHDSTYTSRIQEYSQKTEKPEKVTTERISK